MKVDELLLNTPKIFFDDFPESTGLAIEIDDVKELMIKFAKYHVEEALKAGADQMGLYYNGEPYESSYTIEPYDTYYDRVTISVAKESVLEAYPLDNIK